MSALPKYNQEENFNFFIPINTDQIFKAVKTSKGKGKNSDKMIVEGVASTSDIDLDGDLVDCEGFILDYFLNSGFINWHHGQTPETYIGFPLDAKVKDGKFYIKAELYNWSPLAKAVYQMARDLAKDGKRKLGWSIEGKVLEKDPVNKKHIKKSIIVNVSITPIPKNPNTWMQIVKGFKGKQIEEYEYEYDAPESGYIIDIIKGGKRIQVDKNFNIFINKAMMANSPGGRAITKESVDSVISNLSGKFKIGKDELRKSLVLIYKGYEEGMIDKNQFNKVKTKIHSMLKI